MKYNKFCVLFFPPFISELEFTQRIKMACLAPMAY